MKLADPIATRPTLYGHEHMISSGHPAATMAGLRILEAGGNAVDAAVAAGFALHVVQCDMANLGGVAPILIRPAGSRDVRAVEGVGRWPKAVTREALAAIGGGRIPVGPERWIVPAAVDAWFHSLAAYGTMSVGEVLHDAIVLAEKGFASNYFIRNNLSQLGPKLSSGTDNARIFLPDGAPPPDGSMIRQPDLARTLDRLVDAEKRASGSREDGIRAARDAFYRGDIARTVDKFARAVGAFLRYEDMAEFAVKEGPALKVRFAGHEVFGCGPWCQGPALLQILSMAELLPELDEADRAHWLIEIVKAALTDRNTYYGDPEAVEVPMERLLSADYARERLAGLGAPERGADPDAGYPERLSPDTTYVCVVDRHGNAVSATPSDSSMIFTPMVPGLGFGVSDRGHQASLDLANPNVVAPGKRPRMTPNPSLVLGTGSVLAFGTPGAEVQPQAMAQFLMLHLKDGLPLQQAVEAPRWATYAVPTTEDPHSCQPGMVCIESRFGEATRSRLAERGHQLSLWQPYAALAGSLCAVRREDSGIVSAAADPRRLSYAMGR